MTFFLIETLADRMLLHGVPEHIRSGNGPRVHRIAVALILRLCRVLARHNPFPPETRSRARQPDRGDFGEGQSAAYWLYTIIVAKRVQ